MKTIYLSLLLFFMLIYSSPVSSQSTTTNQATPIPSENQISGFIDELQKTDPAAARELMSAIQRGDFKTAREIFNKATKSMLEQPPQLDAESAGRLNRALMKGDFDTAKKIIDEFKNKQSRMLTEDKKIKETSLFERTLSGDFPSDIVHSSLEQFGYQAFLQTTSSFTPPTMLPVGPDYIIGPGDQFTLTLWGTTEGIFNLTVTKEGTITLPKVGVISVAGVRFGLLEQTLKRHLSRYYRGFNLSVAMGQLRTNTIYIVGEVTNPGGYQLHSLTTVYGALFAAGGPTKKGSMRNIRVLRSGKVIKTIDLYEFLLRGDKSHDIRLQHEDTVFVPIIGPIAGIAGAVYRPAIYELKGHETIDQIIKEYAGGLMPISLGGRLQLSRFENNKRAVIVDIKLSDVSGSNPDLYPELLEKVQNMDTITVFPVYEKTWETVNLSGNVKYPGNYQWHQDLRLMDIISLGQPLPTTDHRHAEVIRLKQDFMDREIIRIDLDALLKGDPAMNIPLKPKDLIRVYTTYREPEKVMIRGEVVRPGLYELEKGERLSDLLSRVGGFTKEAYAHGTVFKRTAVKDIQTRNLRSMIARMQTQVLQSAAKGAATALSPEEAGFAKAELNLNQSLLEALKSMQEQQEGRVALNITQNIDEWKGSEYDLLLHDGDDIYIPKRPQEVLVIGETYSPGAQIYQEGLKLKDYIARAGGYTKYAEKDEVYVIKANGYSFGASSPEIDDIDDTILYPGDTIFVPQKVERFAWLRMTKDIIDILFKTAVTLATIIVIF